MTSTIQTLTPLMQQYGRLKQEHPGEILFFRLGDFYEMFFEDAIKAAPLLEVALTQRQSVPMCGVPYHAGTSYIAKLLKHGLRVAIAEQMEDPKKTKGMVKREVVRVVTPGTVLEEALLPARANNFLAAVAAEAQGANAGRWALAAADVSTGRLWVGGAEEDFHWTALKSQLASLRPSEILLVGEGTKSLLDLGMHPATVSLEPAFAPHSSLRERRGATAGKPTPVDLKDEALRGLKNFLAKDQSGAGKYLGDPEPLPVAARQESGGPAGEALFLDETAIRHLELVAGSDPSGGPTLLSLLDRCVTAMGSRLLKWWVLHPSTRRALIEARLDQVESFLTHASVRAELRALLKGVADLERICVRVQTGAASPRDLDALRNTLRKLPEIREVLGPSFPRKRESSPLPSGKSLDPRLRGDDDLEVPPELLDILETQLAESPPARLSEGGVVRDGFSPELDELRRFRRSGKNWIAELEAKERERTGIGSLKIGFNDIFGYFLEVSKANLAKVPADWIRKQTMANGERYVTPDLKAQEEKILGAEEKIAALESALFSGLLRQAAAFSAPIREAAAALAHVDTVSALAEAAAERGYVRPRIVETNELVIKGGRHPVIEKELGPGRFIPNDLELTTGGQRINVITGPNMAGKSTYLRQTALHVIMAQAGSFVPAESATIGIVDKIFTRIGASDRLAQGQSTFMVEMQEVAALLSHSTERSLLILDEVGRGTSTYDGMSIAWAVIDHLSRSGPRTLFATHYFELTQLAGKLPGVFNSHATAKEWPGEDGRRQVVFLYQIRPGAADRSYGIHVAEMAGLPQACIDRAREILTALEMGQPAFAPKDGASAGQLDLFTEHPVVVELRSLKVEKLTPLEALNKLAELKDKLK